MSLRLECCPPLRVGGRDGPSPPRSLSLLTHFSQPSDDCHNPGLSLSPLSSGCVTTRNCLWRQLDKATKPLLLWGLAGHDPRSWRRLTATATARGRSSQCGRCTEEEGGREGYVTAKQNTAPPDDKTIAAWIGSYLCSHKQLPDV